MNIVFLDASTIGDVPNLDSLKELGDVTFYDVTRPDETADRIREADVAITNKVVFTRELMKAAENLKLICIAATGMNNVDREAAEDLGIAVKNVAGYASVSVAQTTFAMILHLQMDLKRYDNFVKSGDYSESPIFTNMDQNYREISDMRFGIIGLGNIGRKVADIATAFGAEVVYYSTSGKNTDQPYQRLKLEELLNTSDVVSIHAPLNENTDGLIGAKQLRQMKTTALLINTGRGGIVNEKDLAQALDDDAISGAALDVFEQEPLNPDNPLLKIKNKDRLLLTPHIAWASVEARIELIEGVKNNVKEFIGAE